MRGRRRSPSARRLEHAVTSSVSLASIGRRSAGACRVHVWRGIEHRTDSSRSAARSPSGASRARTARPTCSTRVDPRTTIATRARFAPRGVRGAAAGVALAATRLVTIGLRDVRIVAARTGTGDE
jgi:hypothetical protein